MTKNTDKAKGLWNEKTKSYIKPSGTVKQGRRPMFKPFDDDQTCPKCGSTKCTHVWELDSQPQAQHSPLPWSYSGIGGDNLIMCRKGHDRVAIAEVLYDEAKERISIEEMDANKAFIVASVNHAGKLAEALRGIVGAIESGRPSSMINTVCATQALAAWEGAKQ